MGAGGGGLQRRAILPVKICPHQHLDKQIQVTQSFQPAHASAGEAGGIWGSRLVSDALLGCSFTLSLFSSHPGLLISGFLSGVNLKPGLGLTGAWLKPPPRPSEGELSPEPLQRFRPVFSHWIH